MVQTQMAGRIELAADKVRADLETAEKFRFSEAYSNYLTGGPWKSLVLWAAGGADGDGVVTNYDHDKRTAITPQGEQLPYLRQLVEENFNLGKLTMVRLVQITNVVTLPHRDLIELADLPDDVRTAHRMHVPLETNEDALFIQGNTVFQMKPGDIWFFDASRVHGAASLAPGQTRTHLMLDFADVASPDELVTFETIPAVGIPADRTVKREVLTGEEVESLYRLAEMIDLDNYRDVLGLVIKKHYRKDGGEDFVWNTITEIGRRSADPAVRARIEEERRYFLLERSA